MQGSRLKAVREDRQLTQIDLSNRAGVSLKQLWPYEHDESDPTSDVLARLAKELEVSMDYLAGLVDDPQARLSEEELTPMERNAAGARAEQRHQDLLAIERERNWIMQGGQLRSTRNTPSAYEEEPLDRLFPERRANMERLERMRREGKLTSEAEKIWSQSPRPPAREDFYNAMFPDRKEDPKRVSGSIQNTKRKR